MAINYEIDTLDNLVFVRSTGYDENLEEVVAYGQAILEACVSSGCNRLLCDERGLEYRLGTADIYDHANMMAERAPALGRAAIVCDPACGEDAEFWETVAVNRGLMVRMFMDIDEARRWLGVPTQNKP
jgi:hypothetical protein